MIPSFSSRNTLRLAAFTLATAALTGCGLGNVNSTSGPVEGTLSISGKTFGGLQPIKGTTITVYSVGASGYGLGAASLMTGPAVTTDQNGFFNLTGHYTCASSTAPVYLIASGGDSGAGTNNAIKLATTVGTCGQLQSATYVWINEVTTAATAYALSQYFSPTTDGFGAPNTTQAQLGVSNAIGVVKNLVDTTTGQAPLTTATTIVNGVPTTSPANGSTTITGAAGSITATPESLKLNTVANILAACVNSTGANTGPCGTLFPDVTPTGGTAPTNTLEAAVLLNTNPTSNNAAGSTANITSLYGLQTATSPYTGLASQPTDWTIGINYASATLFPQAQNIAIDASGNAWVVNNGSSTNGLLTEISPSGSATVSTTMPTTVGATAVNISTLNPRNIAIDLNGNIIVPTSSSSGYTFGYNPTSAASTAVASGKSPYGVAVDGNNNIFVTQQSTSSTYQLTEYLGGTLATTSAVQFPLVGQTVISSGFATNAAIPQNAAFDFNGNLWFDAGSSLQSTAYVLSGISSATCSAFPCQVTSAGAGTTAAGSGGTNYYTTVTAGSVSGTYGLIANTASMWIVDNSSANVSKIGLAGTTGTAYGPTTTNASPAPRFGAADGSGNVWVSNRGTSVLSEFNLGGTLLSPAAGFAHAGIGTANAVAVDPSGNVWIANNTTSGSTTDPNSIFEVIGAATPVVTPLAMQVKNGAISKP